MKAAILSLMVAAALARSVSETDSCDATDSCGDAVQLLQHKPAHLSQVRQVKEAPESSEDPQVGKIGLTAEMFHEGMRDVAADEFQKCFLNESDCTLEGMKGQPTLVYPGGKTICFDGGEYAFAVFPGASNKLLFNLQGGGACWETADGTLMKLCTETLAKAISASGLGEGVFNKQNPDNAFKDYHVVEALYCGGSGWVGNVTIEKDGKTYYQHDYINALAVVAWAKKNFPSKLDAFSLAGQSAGSVGVGLWTDPLLKTFRSEQASIIQDSYIGAFPKGVQGKMIKGWGVCSYPILAALDEQFVQDCEDETLSIVEVETFVMNKYKTVAFTHFQSKNDHTQLGFLEALAISWKLPGAAILALPQFLHQSEEIFRTFHKVPNHVSYVIDHSNHVFMVKDIFFNTSVSGKDTSPPFGTLALDQFTSEVVKHASVESECKPDDLERYCRAVVPKALVVG